MVLLALKPSIYGNREMGDETRYRLQNYTLQWRHIWRYNLRQLLQTAIEISLHKIIFIHYPYASFHRLILYNYFYLKVLNIL